MGLWVSCSKLHFIWCSSVEISPSLAEIQKETVGEVRSHLSKFRVECRDAADRSGWRMIPWIFLTYLLFLHYSHCGIGIWTEDLYFKSTGWVQPFSSNPLPLLIFSETWTRTTLSIIFEGLRWTLWFTQDWMILSRKCMEHGNSEDHIKMFLFPFSKNKIILLFSARLFIPESIKHPTVNTDLWLLSTINHLAICFSCISLSLAETLILVCLSNRGYQATTMLGDHAGGIFILSCSLGDKLLLLSQWCKLFPKIKYLEMHDILLVFSSSYLHILMVKIACFDQIDAWDCDKELKQCHEEHIDMPVLLSMRSHIKPFKYKNR